MRTALISIFALGAILSGCSGEVDDGWDDGWGAQVRLLEIRDSKNLQAWLQWSEGEFGEPDQEVSENSYRIRLSFAASQSTFMDSIAPLFFLTNEQLPRQARELVLRSDTDSLRIGGEVVWRGGASYFTAEPPWQACWNGNESGGSIERYRRRRQCADNLNGTDPYNSRKILEFILNARELTVEIGSYERALSVESDPDLLVFLEEFDAYDPTAGDEGELFDQVARRFGTRAVEAERQALVLGGALRGRPRVRPLEETEDGTEPNVVWSN